MRILAIIGSPRKRGNTYHIIRRIENTIKNLASIEFEYLFLGDSHLEMCKGCGICLFKGDEFCPNKDDRKLIEEKILNADGVILASPVYAMNMTALMKNFLDRFAFTMHRPRFFNQKTMIISVTGAVGLKETINSISAVEYSGYNIVNTIGLVAKEPTGQQEIADPKLLKDIDKASKDFYKHLIDKKALKPSLNSVIQFRVQQKVFGILKDQCPCDHNYFKAHGWLDEKRKHFVANAEVHPLKDIIARSIGRKAGQDILKPTSD